MLYQLHLRYTRASSKLSDILALRGFIIRPLCENTLSTGAELAGMKKILENSDPKQLYSGSVQILDAQSGLNSGEFIVARNFPRTTSRLTADAAVVQTRL